MALSRREGRTMRSTITLLLLLSPLAAPLALAQTDPITIVCNECRDPDDHSEDYINHAFNQIYGPDAWMDFDQADDFYILGPDGQLVYVDVDYVMLGIGLEGLRLPFWPTNLLKFTLALPNGNVVEAIRSKFLAPLPVPANANELPPDDNSVPETGDGADGGSEGTDEDESDTIEEEPEDPEIDGNVGVTGIEDPDEDGFFSDADWCEEC